MAKGRKWVPHEHMALAKAYIDVSEEMGAPVLKGTGQTVDAFWKAVKENLEKASFLVDDIEGRYASRDVKALRQQFSVVVARNVKKFNVALRLVYRSRPTGVTDQQKINMAIAIHTKKTNCMHYRFKDCSAEDWNLYEAWKLLKDHPGFKPTGQPKTPTINRGEEDEEEEEEDEDDEDEDGGDDEAPEVPILEDSIVLPVPDSTTSPVSNFASPVSRTASRGPGPGSKKTKADEATLQLRFKKAKLLEEATAIQRAMLVTQREIAEIKKIDAETNVERTIAYKKWVTGTMHQNKFNMCLAAYDKFKDNPAKKKYYEEKMTEIMNLEMDSGADDDDEDEGLPPLDASVSKTRLSPFSEDSDTESDRGGRRGRAKV